MVALLIALTIIIVSVGALCYLVDVMVDEQRQTNEHLTVLRRQQRPEAAPAGQLYREWLHAETERRRGNG